MSSSASGAINREVGIVAEPSGGARPALSRRRADPPWRLGASLHVRVRDRAISFKHTEEKADRGGMPTTASDAMGSRSEGVNAIQARRGRSPGEKCGSPATWTRLRGL